MTYGRKFLAVGAVVLASWISAQEAGAQSNWVKYYAGVIYSHISDGGGADDDDENAAATGVRGYVPFDGEFRYFLPTEKLAAAGCDERIMDCEIQVESIKLRLRPSGCDPTLTNCEIGIEIIPVHSMPACDPTLMDCEFDFAQGLPQNPVCDPLNPECAGEMLRRSEMRTRPSTTSPERSSSGRRGR